MGVKKQAGIEVYNRHPYPESWAKAHGAERKIIPRGKRKEFDRDRAIEYAKDMRAERDKRKRYKKQQQRHGLVRSYGRRRVGRT